MSEYCATDTATASQRDSMNSVTLMIIHLVVYMEKTRNKLQVSRGLDSASVRSHHYMATRDGESSLYFCFGHTGGLG